MGFKFLSLRAHRKEGGEMETAGVSICSVETMTDQYGGLAVFRQGAQCLSDTYHQSHAVLALAPVGEGSTEASQESTWLLRESPCFAPL